MNLQRWQPGDKTTAAHLNQSVDAINTHLPVTGGHGITTTILGGGGGTSVSLAGSSSGRAQRVTGVIVATGPAGDEDDYGDYRYWVRLTCNRLTSGSAKSTGTLDLKPVPDPSTANRYPVVVTAYNVADYAGGTHSLPVGTNVELTAVQIDAPQNVAAQVPQVRWMISGGGGDGSFLAKVVRTGPNGSEDEFADQRYWVQAVSLSNDQTDPADGVAEFTGTEDTESPKYKVVPATNLTECVSGGHVVPVGTVVRVYAAMDPGDPAQPRYWFASGTPEIYLRVTGATLIGDGNQWAYQWKQVRILRAGSFEDVPGGLTHGSETFGGLAYNIGEEMNSNSGQQGNGANLSDSTVPGSWTMKPAPTGRVFRAHRGVNCDDVGEWFFDFSNVVSGVCAGGS